jgi:hypothetical protein
MAKSMSEKEPIREGDYVRVPKVSEMPSNLTCYGEVLYIQPPIAVVRLQYGTRIMRQAFRITDLVKIKIITEKEARERYEQRRNQKRKKKGDINSGSKF